MWGVLASRIACVSIVLLVLGLRARRGPAHRTRLSACCSVRSLIRLQRAVDAPLVLPAAHHRHQPPVADRHLHPLAAVAAQQPQVLREESDDLRDELRVEHGLCPRPLVGIFAGPPPLLEVLGHRQHRASLGRSLRHGPALVGGSDPTHVGARVVEQLLQVEKLLLDRSCRARGLPLSACCR